MSCNCTALPWHKLLLIKIAAVMNHNADPILQRSNISREQVTNRESRRDSWVNKQRGKLPCLLVVQPYLLQRQGSAVTVQASWLHVVQ